MARACVLLANGFEEIEAVTLIDVLRRADLEVTTLGVDTLTPRGSHDIEVRADALLADRSNEPWDVVILPGGMPGAAALRDHAEVQALLKRQIEGGKEVAAICAAPIALGAAGVLEGKRATCFPGFEDGLTGASHSTDRVVQDGNVVTSRGPGTAMELALTLVERHAGSEKARSLKQKMLVA